MKTPAELYARAPAFVTHDTSFLATSRFSHVPEFIGDWESNLLGDDPGRRVEIRVLREVHFDSRRFWRLASVWFDGSPVMVIQNAGREGDDHRGTFVTDVGAYVRMGTYLVETFKIPTLAAGVDAYAPDAPAHVDQFYSFGLDEPAESHWQERTSRT